MSEFHTVDPVWKFVTFHCQTKRTYIKLLIRGWECGMRLKRRMRLGMWGDERVLVWTSSFTSLRRGTTFLIVKTYCFYLPRAFTGEILVLSYVEIFAKSPNVIIQWIFLIPDLTMKSHLQWSWLKRRFITDGWME